MLVAFVILLLMPAVELRTTSASAAARAEHNAQATVAATPEDEGSHRAPVETVVGDPVEDEPSANEGRHAGPTATEELQDPR